MDKNEFLETLRGRLARELSIAETAYHVQYYEEYINDELERGHSEQEILESLGNPELIAKTLIDNPNSRTHYDNISEDDITPSARNDYREVNDEPAGDNGVSGNGQAYGSQADNNGHASYTNYKDEPSPFSTYTYSEGLGSDYDNNPSMKPREAGFGNNRPSTDRDTMTGIIIVAIIALIVILAIAALILVFVFHIVKALFPIIVVVAVILIVLGIFKRR